MHRPFEMGKREVRLDMPVSRGFLCGGEKRKGNKIK